MFNVHSRNIKDSVVDTCSVCCQILESFILSLDLMLSAVIYHYKMVPEHYTRVCNKKGIKQGILAGKYTRSPFPLATSAKISIYYLEALLDKQRLNYVTFCFVNFL